MGTPKQEKLIKLLMVNYGKAGETKSLGNLMIEAGYSKKSAKNPKLFLESPIIKEGIEDFIKTLDDKRRLALTKITAKKLEKSNAYQLALITDVLTKNHQLLTGGDTEKSKTVIEISEQVSKRYDTHENAEHSG